MRLTNKQVEDTAIAWVMKYEKAAGRVPVDRRYTRGHPADVESPPRLIEVKAFGTSARGQELWLEGPQFEAARRDESFYLYVIENVGQGDPGAFTLRVLGGDRLQRLLLRAKEHRYFTLPWPVAEYDGIEPETFDSEL